MRNNYYYLLILLITGCATFDAGHLNTSANKNNDPPKQNKETKFSTACVNIQTLNNKTGLSRDADEDIEKLISNAVQSTGKFKEVYVTNTGNLICDINFYFVKPYSNIGFAERLWRIATLLSVAIIPYRQEGETLLSVTIKNNLSNTSREYRYSEKYIYWQSIIFAPVFFSKKYNPPAYSRTSRLINMAIKDFLTDF